MRGEKIAVAAAAAASAAKYASPQKQGSRLARAGSPDSPFDVGNGAAVLDATHLTESQRRHVAVNPKP